MELLVMAAVAVMLFGGDLPATARKAAQAVGRLRSLAAELGREFSSDEHAIRPARMDQKHLADPDSDSVTLAPSLPGRREDEPIEVDLAENPASPPEVFDSPERTADSAEQSNKKEP